MFSSVSTRASGPEAPFNSPVVVVVSFGTSSDAQPHQALVRNLGGGCGSLEFVSWPINASAALSLHVCAAEQTFFQIITAVT